MPTNTTAKKKTRRKLPQRRTRWQISSSRVSVLKPKTVGDFAMPKLMRIVKSLTLSAAAEFLGVDRSQLSRCVKGKEAIGPELARRIANVDFFLDRASHLLWPDEIGPWLTSPEPLLGGSVPLNVLILSGAAQVVGALEARVGGAFA